jgi:CRP/FNR family transcriptional regulator, cyclic AMP receptor protein
MIGPTPPADHFKEQLHEALRYETRNTSTLMVAKRMNIYTCGDHDEMVYFIECGKIKQLMLSPDGKQCLLAIYTSGDIFGELCFAEGGKRQETATAMEDTIVKYIPRARFLLRLRQDSLLEGFIRYLAMRMADQQQAITYLITADSEHRLGKTLLQLAQKLGQKDPRSRCIKDKISHEELSEMVGTTRPRISEFMRRFRELGLIEITEELYLIVKEEPFTAYLTSGSYTCSPHPCFTR